MFYKDSLITLVNKKLEGFTEALTATNCTFYLGVEIFSIKNAKILALSDLPKNYTHDLSDCQIEHIKEVSEKEVILAIEELFSWGNWNSDAGKKAIESRKIILLDILHTIFLFPAEKYYIYKSCTLTSLNDFGIIHFIFILIKGNKGLILTGDAWD